MNPYIKQAIDEWDPLQLFPLAPENEYDRESKRISELFQPFQSCMELSEIIATEFSQAFDCLYTPEDCYSIALRVMELQAQ